MFAFPSGFAITFIYHQPMAIVRLETKFCYNRDGRLVAQAIDLRTQKQFLDMLAKAGPNSEKASLESLSLTHGVDT